MIALLSRNVRQADGARWEIQCAIDEEVPVLGVHIHKSDTYKPPEIQGKRVITWSWDGIAKFVDRLS